MGSIARGVTLEYESRAEYDRITGDFCFYYFSSILPRLFIILFRNNIFFVIKIYINFNARLFPLVNRPETLGTPLIPRAHIYLRESEFPAIRLL